MTDEALEHAVRAAEDRLGRPLSAEARRQIADGAAEIRAAAAKENAEVGTTFEQAIKVNAYSLARRWADRSTDRGAVQGELEELATMTALKVWLTRWTPTQIHSALRAGATPDQVAAATDQITPAGVIAMWRDWDAGQRDLWNRFPDLAQVAEHDRVEQALKSWEEAH